MGSTPSRSTSSFQSDSNFATSTNHTNVYLERRRGQGQSSLDRCPCPRERAQERTSGLDRCPVQRQLTAGSSRSLGGVQSLNPLDRMMNDLLRRTLHGTVDDRRGRLGPPWNPLQTMMETMMKEEDDIDDIFNFPNSGPLAPIRLISKITSTPIPRLSRYLSNATFIQVGDEYYQYIIDYINNSQENPHKFGIGVRNIVQIQRANEASTNLSVSARDRRQIMLWHGTTKDNVDSILEHGFDLPPSNHVRLLQGRGIYFADRVSKSAQYCHERRKPSPGETGCLFLCNVNLGRSQYAEEPNHKLTRPAGGFKSIICKGRRIPSPPMEKNINGVIFPSGNSVDNPEKSNYMVEFNEYVVYNPEQVEIKYLVYFVFTHERYQN